MKKPEKLIVANDAYFGRSVITERSRRLHEKSGKIIEYYVPAERLEEALEVIRFYGEPENWMTKDKDTWNRASPKDHGDKSLIVDYRHPNKDWVGTIVVGGKRAREFLAKHPNPSEIPNG